MIDLDPRERAHEDRLTQIPAANLRSERPGDIGVRGHARPTDPDEVEPAPGEDFVLIQHKLPTARRP